MKRFPKILAATCAAVALSASLALAADAVTSRAEASKSDAAQTQCPVSGSTRMGMNAAAMPRMHSGMWSDANEGADHRGGGHGGQGHGYSGHMRDGRMGSAMGSGMMQGSGQMAMLGRNL